MIDKAHAIASRPGVTFASFGDMLRVPGSDCDLQQVRARGGNVAEGLGHLHAAIEGAQAMGRLSRLPLIIVKCGEVHLLAGETDHITPPAWLSRT